MRVVSLLVSFFWWVGGWAGLLILFVDVVLFKCVYSFVLGCLLLGQSSRST